MGQFGSALKRRKGKDANLSSQWTDLSEDVLVDVSRFLSRAELAHGLGLANRRLHSFFANRLYSRGQLFLSGLRIRPRKRSRLQFWAKDGSKNEIYKNQRKSGKIKSLEFPEVPPPANICAFTRITLAGCRIDGQLQGFFALISTRPICVLFLRQLDFLMRKNSLETIEAVLRLIPKCRSLWIEKCSAKCLIPFLATPAVQRQNVLKIHNFRERFCPSLLNWLHHNPNGEKGGKMVPRRLTLWIDAKIGKGLIEEFPLVRMIEDAFLFSTSPCHFFLRVFCHVDILQFYPIGRQIGHIQGFQLNMENSGEMLELQKMGHPRDVKQLVLWLRRGPKMEAGMEADYAKWEELWHEEYLKGGSARK